MLSQDGWDLAKVAISWLSKASYRGDATRLALAINAADRGPVQTPLIKTLGDSGSAWAHLKVYNDRVS